jgi:hypothetical protein
MIWICRHVERRGRLVGEQDGGRQDGQGDHRPLPRRRTSRADGLSAGQPMESVPSPAVRARAGWRRRTPFVPHDRLGDLHLRENGVERDHRLLEDHCDLGPRTLRSASSSIA